MHFLSFLGHLSAIGNFLICRNRWQMSRFDQYKAVTCGILPEVGLWPPEIDMSFVSATHLFEKACGNAPLSPSRRLEVNSSLVNLHCLFSLSLRVMIPYLDSIWWRIDHQRTCGSHAWNITRSSVSILHKFSAVASHSVLVQGSTTQGERSSRLWKKADGGHDWRDISYGEFYSCASFNMKLRM